MNASQRPKRFFSWSESMVDVAVHCEKLWQNSIQENILSQHTKRPTRSSLITGVYRKQEENRLHFLHMKKTLT